MLYQRTARKSWKWPSVALRTQPLGSVGGKNKQYRFRQCSDFDVRGKFGRGGVFGPSLHFKLSGQTDLPD